MGSSFQNTSTEIGRKLSNSYNADHPFTKTLINTIRNESKERLYRLLKTDPYFLDRHFQLFDVPDKLTGCPTDRLSIFRTKAILYFDPLCIAIYFRKSNLIKYILELGGNVNHENYATGVFSQKSNTQDFMQFPPLCVVIRREFIDGLITFMQHFSFKLEDTRISTFYLNSEIERVITYDDILSYTITVLKIRNNYPLKRLVSVLLRHEIQVRQIGINSKELGELIGLFLLKLTRATLSDSKLRMIATLITALEQVVNSTMCNRNFPRKTMGLAKLKEDFCSDIPTHYNFTGIVCLHVLYQRCLEWGRIGFDHMIISLINNLLQNFSWRPIFLDPECQSHILNLMHVTSSNLSIDTVDQTVFFKIIRQVKELKEEEESKLEWMSKVKKKYNAHRGTYSKFPNTGMHNANDGDPNPDSCHSHSSESYSDGETSKVKGEDTTCPPSPKPKSPEPSKPKGLPVHLLTKTIPYWNPQESSFWNSNDHNSFEEEFDQVIENSQKGRNQKEPMQSIIMCNKSSIKSPAVKERRPASSDVSKSVAKTSSHHQKRSEDRSLMKTSTLSSCSFSYPIADDDIMGPVTHCSPVSMDSSSRKDDDIDVILDEGMRSNAPYNAVASWFLKEKTAMSNNECKVSKTSSISSISSSTSGKTKSSQFYGQSSNCKDVIQEKKQSRVAGNEHMESKNCNKTSSKNILNRPCILHRRERFRSFNQHFSSLRK